MQNTELLIQMLSLQHSWAEQQHKIFSLSPVIVGKCRICQHFLQLHGLHKRPGLLFELMCCATLLRSGGCLHIFFWVTHLEQELIVAIKFYFLLFRYQHHHQPSLCPSNSNVQISHRSSPFQEMLIQEGHFLDQLADSLFSHLHCFRWNWFTFVACNLYIWSQHICSMYLWLFSSSPA